MIKFYRKSKDVLKILTIGGVNFDLAVYGYLNSAFTSGRQDWDITAIFNTVPGEQVVIEQAWSRGDESRPAFDKMLDGLLPGDTLYVSSIDSLGLDAEDAVRLWYFITNEKSTDIIVLNDKALNSRENRELTEMQLKASAGAAYSGNQSNQRRKKRV